MAKPQSCESHSGSDDGTVVYMQRPFPDLLLLLLFNNSYKLYINNHTDN